MLTLKNIFLVFILHIRRNEKSFILLLHVYAFSIFYAFSVIMVLTISFYSWFWSDRAVGMAWSYAFEWLHIKEFWTVAGTLCYWTWLWCWYVIVNDKFYFSNAHHTHYWNAWMISMWKNCTCCMLVYEGSSILECIWKDLVSVYLKFMYWHLHLHL